MRLSELSPVLLRMETAGLFTETIEFAQADGLQFLCPECFRRKGSSAGVHSVICWRPRVPLGVPPEPGRWEFAGKSLGDLTLVAGSSSVKLPGPCFGHFNVSSREIIFADDSGKNG